MLPGPNLFLLPVVTCQTSTSSGLGPLAPPLAWTGASTTETSGGPELSDSLSSGGVVAQGPLRKVKSRVRVRRASISEPSDTDPEPRTRDPSPAGLFMQQHRELELLNSFRERFGCDWLQYRNHLEASGSPLLTTSKGPALSTSAPDALGPEAPPSPLASGKESAQKMAEEGRVEQEPREEEARGEQEEEEEGAKQGQEEEEEEGQEQKEVEAELCRPMLVCPLQRPEGVRGMECFLRVTSAHVVEVELQAARTLGRLELQSLVTAELEPESATRTEPVSEDADHLPRAPILVLRFAYICPDRQLRRYAVLEPDAHAAAQELLAVLSPFTAVAQQQLGEAGSPPGGRFQCLRCGREFRPEEPRTRLGSEEAWSWSFQKTGSNTPPITRLQGRQL